MLEILTMEPLGDFCLTMARLAACIIRKVPYNVKHWKKYNIYKKTKINSKNLHNICKQSIGQILIFFQKRVNSFNNKRKTLTYIQLGSQKVTMITNRQKIFLLKHLKVMIDKYLIT